MTLSRETPKDHGLVLDHDPKGRRRISVTLAGRAPTGNGRRLQNATGTLYSRSFLHVATILRNHHGYNLVPLEDSGGRYYLINEEAAIQIRLLLDAVDRIKPPNRAERVARAVVGMHPCESSWWYAHAKSRERPSTVLKALALMYG